MQDQDRGPTDDSCPNGELTADELTWHGREHWGEVSTYDVIGLADAFNRSARTQTDLRNQNRVVQALGVVTGGVGLLIVTGWICSAAGWLAPELVTHTVGVIMTPVGLCWLTVIIQVFRRGGPT